MGYYASGSGDAVISGNISYEDIEKVEGSDALIFSWDYFTYDENTDETTVFFEHEYGKYYEDDIIFFLNNLCKKLNVLRSEIEFSGEDGEFWRFRYDKERNEFVEENGKPSYLDISPDRLLAIFTAYVNNDLNNADPDYVREVLQDVCGMTESELVATGFDYLFDKDEEDE